MSNGKLTPGQTYNACKDAMDKYQAIWNKDTKLADHFWQISNQVHSYLRFAEVAQANFPVSQWGKNFYDLMDDPEDAYFGSYYTIVQTILDEDEFSPFWADDYGWAGMACISTANAYRTLNHVSEHTWTEWRDLAFRCLGQMNKAAGRDPSQGGTPVAGGLSNCPFLTSPGDVYLKNTVTNGMYFLLSMALYDWSMTYPSDTPRPSIDPPALLATAQSQFTWFSNWIKTAPNTPPGQWDTGIPYNFFRTFIGGNGQSCAVLEDRPVAFSPYTYEPKGAVAFSPDGVWSGDQGIFLAACALFHKYLPNLDPKVHQIQGILEDLEQWFKMVFSGSSQLFSLGVDSVTREAPFSFTFTGAHEIDYLCGRGVLARFVSLDNTTALSRKLFASREYFAFYPTFEQTPPAIYKTSVNKQLAANWNPLNDIDANELFFDVFGLVQGKKPPVFDTHWENVFDPDTAEGALWNNYCMMMGFDFYAAYLKTNPFTQEKLGQNGATHR